MNTPRPRWGVRWLEVSEAASKEALARLPQATGQCAGRGGALIRSRNKRRLQLSPNSPDSSLTTKSGSDEMWLLLLTDTKTHQPPPQQFEVRLNPGRAAFSLSERFAS